MRVFKTRPFTRWSARAGLTDTALRRAVIEIAAGLVDADLGGGVIKKRIARDGGGKSGGFRLLLACRRGERIVFVSGFAKNEQETITAQELRMLRLYAGHVLGLSDADLAIAVDEQKLIEIPDAQKLDS